MRRPALGVYLLAGWPDVDRYLRALEALDGLADFLELGLKSPNPKYDGPFIRRAHGEAQPAPLRAAGETYLMAYWEDRRPEELFRTAAEAGARGVLAPDLLIDFPQDLDHYLRLAGMYGMEPAFFLPSKFPHGLARRLAAHRPAFIYLGLYAATGIELPVYVERNIKVLRSQVGDVPIVAGFAVDSGRKARALVEAGADGVVVGTAFLRRLRSSLQDALALLRELKAAIQEAQPP